MLINPEFEALIKARYEEMKNNGIDEAILNDATLGQIKLFINRKPASPLPLPAYLFGSDTVYIGAESPN